MKIKMKTNKEPEVILPHENPHLFRETSELMHRSELNAEFDFNNVRQKKYILLIFSCFKYQHKAQQQKETWLKNLPKDIEYFHVMANEKIQEDFIIDKENKLIILKCEDDYVNLPKKVIRAYEVVYSCFNFDFILKTDDDQQADVEFFKNITNLINCFDVNYGGFSIRINQRMSTGRDPLHPEVTDVIREPTRYCNGRFYFLSKLAIADLLTKKKEFEQRQVEDYSVGFYLSERIKEKTIYLPDTEKWFKG